MADRHFVGANGSTTAGTSWNAITSWSSTQGGASGSSVPVAGDVVYLNKNKSAIAYINANISWPNGTLNSAPTPNTAFYVSLGAGSNGTYVIAGTNQTTAGTAWTLSNPVTVDIATSASLTFRNNITGGGTITKTGAGGFGTDTIAATTWGTSPISLQGGGLFFNNANNKLGSGKITMSAGTYINSNAANGTTYTLANPLDIRGDVTLNTTNAAGRGQITFTAAVDLDSSTRTINVGGTLTTRFTSNVLFTGVVSGTAGFNLSGDGFLGLTNTGNTISGTATLTGTYLLLGSTAIPPTSSGNTAPSINDISIDSTTYVSVRSNTAFTIPYNITGSGFFQGYVTASGGLTIPSARTSGFTGQIQNYTDSTSTSYVNIDKLYPLNFGVYGSGATAQITYTGAISESMPADIEFFSPSGATNPIAIFAHNGSAGSVLTLGTALSCIGTGANNRTFHLSGSNTEDNTFSGIISNGTATSLGLTKSGVGKWILSGANTHTGSTTISGGTLVLANTNAVQNSTVVWQTAGTTLTLDPSVSNFTFGGLSGTAAGLTLTIDSGQNLSAGNNNASTTYANLIAGSGTFTKIGTGGTTLTGNNTGFTGAAAISNGSLLTGSFQAATDAIPSISSFTVDGGLVVTYSTANSTRTYNITINSATPSNFLSSSSYFGSGGISSTDTVLHTYTGTISGTGAFMVYAPGEFVVATRYVRTKSSSLPATLGLASNSVTSNGFRRGTYEWGGGNYDAGTNVLLDTLSSNITTSNDVRGIFAIVHSGTTDTEFVLNNINKTSGTATVYDAYLRLGSASDVGDIRVKGVISQSVSSLGIDKQGPRKLTLSGANTYTYNTLVSGGELVIKNTNAVQNSTVVWQTAGTTLTLDPSVSNFTFGGLSGTEASLTLNIDSAQSVSVGNNNASSTFANAISGSGTLTKVGTGTQTYSGSFSGFTGTTQLTNGIALYRASSFAAATFNHATTGVRASKLVSFIPTVTGGYSFPAGFQLTGNGMFGIDAGGTTSISTGFTFPSGALSGLTGTAAGSASGGVAGIIQYVDSTSLNNIVNINEFPGGGSPGVYGFEFVPNSATNLTNSLYYISAAATHTYQTRVEIIHNSATANSSTANLYANQATGALILSGGIVRYAGGGATQTAILNLRGTSTADNEISGAITQTSGVLSISKVDAGKWILSGAGTHTGNTTISGGELVIKNTNALQNSTLVWQTAGTTLTFDPSLSSFTFGGLSSSAAGLTLTIPSGDTLSVGNNNSSTTWANAISGPGNLTKIGTGVLTISGDMSGFASTATVSAGALTFDSSNFGAMTISHPTVGVRLSKYVSIRPTVTNGYSFPAGFNLSGLGLFIQSTFNITSQTTGLTYPAGALSGITGSTAGAATGSVNGFTVYANAANATQRIVTTNVNDLPRVFSYEFDFNTTSQNLTHNLYYVSDQASHNYSTRIDIININGTSTIGSNTQTANLYANQASGALVLSGGIVRYSSLSTYVVTLNLRGNSTADNEISGAITQTSGVLAIQKSDAGKWELTGANSFTGGVTLSGGTLYCNNGSAGATSSLGSSAATGAVTLAGGTLQLDGCDSSRTSSAMTVSANSTVQALSGTNGLRVSGTTINNGISLTTDVADGTTMLYSGTFTYGGSDSPNRFVKTGLGTLRLTSTTSTWANAGWLFTNGTVEFANIANSGGSSFGNSGSLTFRGNITVNHTGTAASTTTRSLTLGDATVACTNFVLNTNGVGGSLTFDSGSNLNIASTASPISIELGGTNSGTNSTYWLIEDSSGGGVVSLIKSGSCNWTLNTRPTYTGITICSGTGTLKFELFDSSAMDGILLSGGLNISGGTVTTGDGMGIEANIIMSGGTINTYLGSSNRTLDIQSGASEASPATIICSNSNGGSNYFAGGATINGCVDIKTPTSVVIGDASQGTVLGVGTVTVGSSGIIRTKGGTSTLQEGRASYENLTLGNGAKLKIGFAA